MRKNIIIALKLFVVTAISALLIASIDSITAPIIKKNKEKEANQIYTKIYADFNYEKSSITKKDGIVYLEIEARDANDNLLGYIYCGSDKNQYGNLDLVVGITTAGIIKDVKILENTQSFKSIVDNHITSNYISDMPFTDVFDIDTKCGATYGAKTAKKIVESVIAEYQTSKGGQ